VVREEKSVIHVAEPGVGETSAYKVVARCVEVELAMHQGAADDPECLLKLRDPVVERARERVEGFVPRREDVNVAGGCHDLALCGHELRSQAGDVGDAAARPHELAKVRLDAAGAVRRKAHECLPAGCSTVRAATTRAENQRKSAIQLDDRPTVRAPEMKSAGPTPSHAKPPARFIAIPMTANQNQPGAMRIS
jgi:hypothetical protein